MRRACRRFATCGRLTAVDWGDGLDAGAARDYNGSITRSATTLSRRERITTKADDAATTFNQGFNCSQAVLSAFAEEFGLDRETALRVAAAFGGGLARTGETCGAVTGALMVIGMKYGKVRAEDDAAKLKTYEIAREFMRRFNERHGHLACRDLLGHDVGTPEGRRAIAQLGLHDSVCAGLVRDAVRIVTQVIKDETVR